MDKPSHIELKSGYYIVPRDLGQTLLAGKTPAARLVYDYLVSKANHQARNVGGKTFERGQCLARIDEIREALSWHRGWKKEMFTRDEVKTALRCLREATMIATRKTTRGMIITVINYDYYQTQKNYEATKESTDEGPRLTPTKTPDSHQDKQAFNHLNHESIESGAAFPPSEEGESGAPLGIPPEKDCPPIDYIPEAPGPWEAQLPLPLPWREFVRYLGDTGKDVESGMLSALEGIEDIEDGYTAFVGSSFVIKQVEKYRKELEELAGQFFSKPVMITFKVKQEQKGDNRGRLYQGSSSTHC